MTNIHLPGFEVAPCDNLRLLGSSAPDVDSIIYGGLIQEPMEWDRIAAEKILRRRRILTNFTDSNFISLEKMGVQKVASWDDLYSETADAIDEMFGNKYMGVPSKADKSFTEIANEGVATANALLAVTGKVLFRHEFNADPNDAVAAYACGTVGLIRAWALLHGSVDPELACALSVRHPRRLNDVFEDLRFNDKWFVADAKQRLRIDPGQVANLRGFNHALHPSVPEARPGKIDEGPYALFGCPARNIIPALYLGMASVAQTSGLFGRTYHEMRQNHGYAEYTTQEAPGQ